MSVERSGRFYIPVCDGKDCDAQLLPEASHQDAVRAMEAAGWKRRHSETVPRWGNYCRECQKEEQNAKKNEKGQP